MVDLSVEYMGLKLKNPLIVGSSGLTDSVEKAQACERAGAGAVVLKSIFEEQISAQNREMAKANAWYPAAADYIYSYGRQNAVSHYLDLVSEASSKLSIPVIASIHCVAPGSWTEFAARAEKAGADAIELNVFVLPISMDSKSEEYERIYFDILRSVREQVSIPIALKIGMHFSALASTARALGRQGVDGLVIFNRFYRMDIDINQMELIPGSFHSTPEETLVPLRWVSLLSGQTECDLAATTGIHSGETVVKYLLAGASAAQVCTILYEKGVDHLGSMLDEISYWMESKGMESVGRFQGRLSRIAGPRAAAWERVQFMKYSVEKA